MGETIQAILTDALTICQRPSTRVGRMDKELALADMKTMETVVGGAVSATRFMLFLMDFSL